MKIKKELVLREIAGDYILVPIGDTVFEHEGLFAMNEVACCIWNALPEAENEADLLKAVCSEFDVEEAVARQDLQEFLSCLRQYGIID